MLKIKLTENGYFVTHPDSKIGEINAGIKGTDTLFVYQLNNAKTPDIVEVLKKMKKLIIWHFEESALGYVLNWDELKSLPDGSFLKLGCVI